MTRRQRTHCPIAFALDVFGDPWTLLILRDLIFKGKARYQEFLESEEGISTNILADRLSRLEMAGMIAKRADPRNGRQYLYSPTEKGLDLTPVIVEMIRWSSKHDPKTATPREFLRRLEEDPEGLMADVLAPFSGIRSSRRKRNS